MNQRYKFTEQDIEIISKARADNHNDRAEIRLYALQLRAEGMQAKEIALRTGVSAPYVSQLVAKYFKGGIEAIAGNHYGGNRRNMSYEEEEAILLPFYNKAEQGETVEVADIKKAYQENVSHKISEVQIYRVLERHGWRGIKKRNKRAKEAGSEAAEAAE